MVKQTPDIEDLEEVEELPYIFMRVPEDFLNQIEEFGAITREGGLTFFKEVNPEVIGFMKQSQGQKLFRVYLEEYAGEDDFS